jgi:hypothetical protein
VLIVGEGDTGDGLTIEQAYPKGIGIGFGESFSIVKAGVPPLLYCPPDGNVSDFVSAHAPDQVFGLI